MIVYDRLWITLKKKNISQYALIKDYGIDKAQLQRLRKNMVVKTVILNRLCSILRSTSKYRIGFCTIYRIPCQFDLVFCN